MRKFLVTALSSNMGSANFYGNSNFRKITLCRKFTQIFLVTLLVEFFRKITQICFSFLAEFQAQICLLFLADFQP